MGNIPGKCFFFFRCFKMDVIKNDTKVELDGEIRVKMKKYWEVFEPSLKSMMLSHDADHLAEKEQNEVLSYLPSIEKKTVLELGSGIGRFTVRLADVAERVIAVDFMESYVEKNRSRFNDNSNVTCLCADVTKATFEKASFDFVFSNWLLMYLSDSEVTSFMDKALSWLKPEGFFFFRESCYHPSGNVARSENPTNYRSLLQYTEFIRLANNDIFQFDLLWAKNIRTYIELKGNPNQLCFLAQKNKTFSLSPNNKFLHQKSISKIENMSSVLCLSCGEELLKSVFYGLTSADSVLLLQCGFGSVTEKLAKFAGFIHSVDSSSSQVQSAIIRQQNLDKNLKKKIQYEIAEWTSPFFCPKEAYDCVILLDILLFRDDIVRLIKRIKNWLNPGGQLCTFIMMNEDGTSRNDDKELITESEFKNLLTSDSNLILKLITPLCVSTQDLDKLIALRDCTKSKLEQSRNELKIRHFGTDMITLKQVIIKIYI